MLGLAVAAMTSCSNDELMEVNTNNVITFESHVNKGTRAVTPTDANLSSFYVFGNYSTEAAADYAKVAFNNIQVGKNANTGVAWTEGVYRFGAYATKNASDKLTKASYDASVAPHGQLTFTDYEVSQDCDLVAAIESVDNAPMNNEQVNLTFKHMLSQVKFKFTNTANGYKMVITELNLKNVATKGTCVYNNTGASWTPAGTVATHSYTCDGTRYEFGGAPFTSESFFVIPDQEFTSITATVNVDFYDNGGSKVSTKTYNANVQLTDGKKWKAGTIYQYTADISASTQNIVFGVKEIVDWVNSDPGASLN